MPATIMNYWLDVTSQIIKRYSPIEHKMGKNYSELHLRVSSRKEAIRIKNELWALGYVTSHRLTQSKKLGTQFWVDIAKPSTFEIGEIKAEHPTRPVPNGDTLLRHLNAYTTPDVTFPATGFYRIERNPKTCRTQIFYNAGGLDAGVITCSEDELGVILEDLWEDGLKDEFKLPFKRKKSAKKPEREIKQVEVNLESFRTLVKSYEPGKPRGASVPMVEIKKQNQPAVPTQHKPRFVVEVWDGTKGLY